MSDKYSGTLIRKAEPSYASLWDEIAQDYPHYDFTVISKAPTGFYVLDFNHDQVAPAPKKIKHILLPADTTLEEMAEVIIERKPDLAIPMSTSSIRIDWNFLGDAVIAEMLQAKGIKTAGHNVYTSIASVDKWRSHLLLRELGFNVARAVYVHRDLFLVEKQDKGDRITNNVYKEYILHRVKGLDYPIIIKNTTGVASIGIHVANNFQEAEAVLLSEDFNADVIAEELIRGEQFGTEIHGANGHYEILMPFAFNSNGQGITEPTSIGNIKLGPINNKEGYHLDELKETLLKLAKILSLSGCAQVDLVFKDEKWYIIEINPRTSGLTMAATAAQGRNPVRMIVESGLCEVGKFPKAYEPKCVLNFKLSNITDEELEHLSKEEHVLQTASIISARFRMIEVIYGGFDTFEQILQGIKELQKKYADIIPEIIVKNVESHANKFEK